MNDMVFMIVVWGIASALVGLFIGRLISIGNLDNLSKEYDLIPEVEEHEPYEATDDDEYAKLKIDWLIIELRHYDPDCFQINIYGEDYVWEPDVFIFPTTERTAKFLIPYVIKALGPNSHFSDDKIRETINEWLARVEKYHLIDNNIVGLTS